MSPVKRFSFALITSLGLASSAIAAPIDLTLSKAELLTETVYNNFSQAPDNKLSDIDVSKINLSYGIQTHGHEFNFLKNEIVKANTKPIRVPEPSAALLLALGLIGLTVLRRRKH